MTTELTSAKMATQLRDHLYSINMSQAEFCRRVGVSQKHVSEVFHGHTTARPGTLDFWAFCLGLEWEVTLKPREEQ